MKRSHWILAAALSLAACEEKSTCPPGQPCEQPGTGTASEAENVVPTALDPNRAQPPPPSRLEVARDQERVPPAETEAESRKR